MEPWEMTRDEYVKADLSNKRKHGIVGSGRFGGAKGLRTESEKWHKRFVQDAIDKGKPVPPEVLKDYPDLVKKEERRYDMNKSKKVLDIIEKEKDSVIKKYPELDKIADKIAYETLTTINSSVERVKSEMPYKAQYVLEEVIKMLKERV